MNNSLFIKFFNFSFSNQLLLIEASVYTIWAFIMIHIFSFKHYLNWIKNPTTHSPSEANIQSVFLTIRKIRKHAFWPTTCYTQAIAARLILRRMHIKSKIYLGITKNEKGELLAHAWTKVDDKIITGENVNLEKYKVLYVFED